MQEGYCKVGKKLRPLLECMFVSLLMHHTQLIKKFGQTHVMALTIIRPVHEV